MIQLNLLNYTYPFAESPALTNINLEIKKGKIILLTGPSGCGKTTLLKIFSGLIPYFFQGKFEGALLINGKRPQCLKDVAENVGMMMQNPEEQFLGTIVESEIATSLEWRLQQKNEIIFRVNQAITTLGLEKLRKSSIFNLSQGEKQKCAIASILALESKIILLDEPTSNLSEQAVQELAILCHDLSTKGLTIIIADHRLFWLKNKVDIVAIMQKGTVVKYFEKKLDQCPLEYISFDEIHEWGLRDIKINSQKKYETNFPPRLILEKLSFSYDSKLPIFQDAHFFFPGGIISVLVGDNGVGKTTLAKIISGLLKPTSGKIFLDGQEIKSKNLRICSSLVMQNMDVQLYMTSVWKEITSCQKKTKISDQEAKELLQEIGLWHLRERHPHSLSGGQKQRLVIACMIARKTDILILDEPTSGLDGRNMRMMARLLKNDMKKNKVTIVISHDREFLNLLDTIEIKVGGEDNES